MMIAASYDEFKLIAEEENPISEQMLIQFTTEEQGEITLQKEHANPVQS
jgi:hypothetical protein